MPKHYKNERTKHYALVAYGPVHKTYYLLLRCGSVVVIVVVVAAAAVIES